MYHEILHVAFKDGRVDISRCCAFLGNGTGPVHLRNVYCSSTEQRLIDCSYDNDTYGYDHENDWSVICNNSKFLKLEETWDMSSVMICT